MDLLTIQWKEIENPEQACLWKKAFHKHYGITFERGDIIVVNDIKGHRDPVLVSGNNTTLVEEFASVKQEDISFAMTY